MTQEMVTSLTKLTSRVDTRLAEIETTVKEIEAEIKALQERLQTLKSRLLLIYNLIALLVTLLCIWVIYSQVVVIRHHWRLFRSPAASVVLPLPSEPGSTNTQDEGMASAPTPESTAEDTSDKA